MIFLCKGRLKDQRNAFTK